MKSIALYARVSSEQQAQQATVESQVAALKQRAESDGHVVLPQDVYVDEGSSGATLVRPALEPIVQPKGRSSSSTYTAPIDLLASTPIRCCCSTNSEGTA